MKKKITLRPVKVSDSKLLFNWVNEKEVRNNSLNNEVINWQNHDDWFNKKFQSNKCKIFLLENNKIPLGQVRIEEEAKGLWLIDYSIDSAFRGKGFGFKIVDLLIKKIPNSKFKAVVKIKNIASQRVFEKLNFKFKKMEKVIEYTFNCE